MTTTHLAVPRHAPAAAGKLPHSTGAAHARRPSEHAPLDPDLWQRILQSVRSHHPSLHRVWFDQMVPRQLTNGVIQVTVATPAQLNFCQNQCQTPFTNAAQSVTNRLVSVSFHCENLPRGGVFGGEGDEPLPLNPDYTFEHFV